MIKTIFGITLLSLINIYASGECTEFNHFHFTKLITDSLTNLTADSSGKNFEIHSDLPDERPPEVINLKEIRSKISYPREAIDDSIQGKVWVKVLVDMDGTVNKYQYMSGPIILYIEVIK